MPRPLSQIAVLCLCAALQPWAQPAWAGPTPELEGRYAAGEYLAAAAGAEQAGDADNLAFAARAVLAECLTGEGDPPPALVNRALADAESAVRQSPRHPEGRLQLAIALSLRSRSMGLMEAWRAGYGERGRALAESVLRDDPNNHYALGFLSVWNLEVRRRGGKLGAAVMGASIEAGRRAYLHAVQLAPQDIGVRWQYARALAALDGVRFSKEARQALEAALQASPRDSVERVMQERARELARTLADDGAAAAQRQALAML